MLCDGAHLHFVGPRQRVRVLNLIGSVREETER